MEIISIFICIILFIRSFLIDVDVQYLKEKNKIKNNVLTQKQRVEEVNTFIEKNNKKNN